VYVCSNAAIARQNINRLNVTWNNLDSGEEGSTMTLATRLTLLPLHFKDLEKKAELRQLYSGNHLRLEIQHRCG